MKKFFESQMDRVLSKFSKSVKKEIDPEDLIGVDEDGKLMETMEPLWKDSYIEAFNVANNMYGFGLNFSLLNPYFKNWVESDGAELVKGINNTTKEGIKEAVSAGIQAGEGMPKVRNRIKNVFEGASNYRATMIARTETHNSVSTGTFHTYQEAEVERKEWLATMDARTRESHSRINRQVRDMDEPFSNGLMYPGASGPAREVIHCRCTLLPVFE